MNHLDLELEILTPAFLGGADQHKVEIRGASIKGMLRWWWRASEGHRFRNLAELAEAEAAVFGSAEMNLKSPLQIGVELLSNPVQIIPRGKDAPTSAAVYSYQKRDKDGRLGSGNAQAIHYLGYGPIRLPSRDEREAAKLGKDPALVDEKGQLKTGALYIRPAFNAGSRLRVRLAWRNGALSSDQQRELLGALAAWVALGGIGCRSRKGFGSLHLAEPVAASSPQLAEQASAFVRETLERLKKDGDPLPSSLPKWPQVRYRRLLHSTKPKPSWEEALGAIALEYRKVRPRIKDGDRRFICGDANPRRASSVFVSIHWEKDGFVGIMVALPCWKDERSEARQAWDSFLRSGT